MSAQVEEATDGWIDVPFGSEHEAWCLRLLQPERLDDGLLGVARIVLRSMALRDELKRSRFDD